MSDYVYLKNLNGQQIKPVTDLAAINMTTTNGIGVSTVNGGTIGIIDGYIESAYYTEMADPAVGAANVSSAYVDGGTAVAILGAYTVASAVDTAAPSQQKVPSEKAVVDALNNVVVTGVSYYAGTGINIDQGHTVSVANVPQSSVAGLETTLTGINTAVAAKQDAISAGYRMSLDGTTLNQKRYFDIESPTSTTITLQAGHAYKITATNSSKTLDSEQIPSNQFGLEGHAEIFVAGTGLIKTTSNVVLAQALEPDAVNNCTVRFHDGKAIISVEDHVAGYIVISASGTTAGTLPYALSTASNEYISFDAGLNNTTLDMAGAVTNGEKHVVGNGYTDTILTGGVSCTSKTAFANLAMQGVSVLDGTAILGDVYIPNGATVSVSGGGLAVEKVTGNGGMIDLGGTHINADATPAYASGCTFSGGSSPTDPGGALLCSRGTIVAKDCSFTGNKTNGGNGGAIHCGGGKVELSGCCFSGNTVSGGGFGGGVCVQSATSVKLTGCTFSYNTAGWPGQDLAIMPTATAHVNILSNCQFKTSRATPAIGKQGVYINGGTTYIAGCSFVGNIVCSSGAIVQLDKTNSVSVLSGSASVSAFAGANIDLTGNTNATPVDPTGGITFAPGGATILTGATAGVVDASYMLGGMTVPQLGNTNVVNLNSSNVVISSGGTAYASGCTFSGGSALEGGVLYLSGAANQVGMTSVSMVGNSAGYGGAIRIQKGATVTLSSCIISGNSVAQDGGGILATSNAVVTLTGCTVTGNEKGTGTTKYGKDIYIALTSNVTYTDCTIGETIFGSNGGVTLVGSNAIDLIQNKPNFTGSVTISPGAVLDLTGNTNATPIAPGGGITFESGGATVFVNGGTEATSSSYMLDNITLPAGAKLTNTNVVNLGRTVVVIPSGATASASGVEVTSGNGNLRVESNARLELTSCNITSGTSSYGAALYVAVGGTARLTGCTLHDNTGGNAVYVLTGSLYMSGCSCTDTLTVRDAAVVTLAGENTLRKITSFNGSPTQSNATVTISSGASIALTEQINFGGNITVLDGGCTVNGNTIPAGTYTSINSNGQPT